MENVYKIEDLNQNMLSNYIRCQSNNPVKRRSSI